MLPDPNPLPTMIDGEFVEPAKATISVFDEGVLRGDGAFEVVRVYDGFVFALDEHLIRMQRTAAKIRLPLDVEAIQRDIAEVLAVATANSAIRIVVTRGGRRIVLSEALHSWDPVRVTFVEYRPTVLLNGAKTLSYAANMLATRLAQEQGYDEALLTTPEGVVLEAPTAALFIVTADDELVTPRLDDGQLASVTRKLLVEELQPTERVCTRDDVWNAKEAFLASTTREITPILAVEDVHLPTETPISDRAAERFTAIVSRARDAALADSAA
jgi:branched-chain amino acid aminotransferase